MAGGGAARVRAAILAGGKGSRLGGEKASAELAGRPLIAYPVEAARGAGLDPFVVAKRGSGLPELDCEVVREPDEPTHPLLGIVTALEASSGNLLVLGCDMPFATARLLSWLAERDPPTVAEIGGRIEPLLAIYAPGAAERLRGALAEEAPLRAAVEALRPERVGDADLGRFGDPRRLVSSVNTEADLAEAARLLNG